MYSRKLYEYYAKIDGKMRVIEIFSRSETENCGGAVKFAVESAKYINKPPKNRQNARKMPKNR